MPVFESFMTGMNAGNATADRRTRMMTGQRAAAGDFAGASQAAYQGGDLQTGGALALQGRQQQVTPLLQGGRYDEAAQIPGLTPEELAQIQTFRSQSDEQTRKLAADKFTMYGSIAAGLLNVPAEQRAAEAARLAPIIGMDPSLITPDMLSDAGLQTLIARSIGTAEYLQEQRQAAKDERDATRPIVTPFGIMMPPGAQVPGMPQASAPAADPPPPAGFVPARPNQAPVRAGAERSQTPTVSFGSTGQAQAAIRQAIPGVGFTSGLRSPADNARVGGVRNSNHLKGRAWDLTPPRGMTMAQLEAKARSLGFRVLNEGDHVHVSW